MGQLLDSGRVVSSDKPLCIHIRSVSSGNRNELDAVLSDAIDLISLQLMPDSSYAPEQTAITPLTKYTLFELVQTYQALSAYSEVFVRQFDLTPAQFDVIATLGNAPGMNTGEIGERTLITKGTLTGVIDRLEKKGLVQREVPAEDRRSVVVKLTAEGQVIFNRALPAHVADIERRFGQLEASELELLRVLLSRVRGVFS